MAAGPINGARVPMKAGQTVIPGAPTPANPAAANPLRMESDSLVRQPNRTAATGLIAEYNQIPELARKHALAIERQFPTYAANKAYADKLMAGDVGGDPIFLVSELMRVTDPDSGTNKLAEAIGQLEDLARVQKLDLIAGTWAAATRTTFACSLDIDDTEVVRRLAGLLGTIKWVDFAPVSALLGQLPGHTEASRRAIEKAREDIRAIEAAAVQKPNTVMAALGAKSKMVLTSDQKTAIGDAHIRAIRAVASVIPPSRENFDAAGARRVLLGKLLEHQVNGTHEWQIFTADGRRRVTPQEVIEKPGPFLLEAQGHQVALDSHAPDTWFAAAEKALRR